MEPTIEVITKRFNIPFTGFYLTVNPVTLGMTWLVIGIVLVIMLLLKGRLSMVPNRPQSFLEMMVAWFDNMLEESLGKDGRAFLPFIMTLFLFVLISNLISIVPTLKSPTADLNTCFALAIMVFLVAHVSAIKKLGFKVYLRHYFEPFWWLFPSNLISEFSKMLSHALRLFGNMFAGGLLIAFLPFIVMKILKVWGIPLNLLLMPVCNLFFGVVVGCIQAFVFAILAVSYITVLRS